MLYTSTRDNQTTWTARHALDNDRAQDGGLFVPVHLPRFSPEEILELLNMAPSDAAARILNLLFAGSMSGRDLEFLVGKEFFRIRFSPEEILELLNMAPSDAAARILNLLFAGSMSGRDLEFLVGKEFFRIRKLNHRLTIGELWRNPEGEYDKTVQTLFSHLCRDHSNRSPSIWAKTAVELALIFGVFTQLEYREGEYDKTVQTLFSHLCRDHSNRSPSIWAKTAVELALIFGVFTQLEYRTVESLTERKDVAVATGDFTAPMAAWYARQMGLPIGAILCCCNDNGGVWDLFRKGQMKTDIPPIPTNTPLCDISVPTGLEWLIYETLGTEGALGFAHAAETGDTYELDQVSLSLLKKGLYASVVGQQRIMDIIPNVYSAGGYVLSPYSALCYLGLMDHRAMTGKGLYASVVGQQRIMDIIPNVYSAGGYVLSPYSALCYLGLMDHRAMTGANAPALMLSHQNPADSEPLIAKAMGIDCADARERIKYS